jgi:fructose-1,6-bisphosphatase II
MESALSGEFLHGMAACGVTHGRLLRGVRLFGEGMRTSSLILNRQPRRVRFVDTVHVNEGEGITVRF